MNNGLRKQYVKNTYQTGDMVYKSTSLPSPGTDWLKASGFYVNDNSTKDINKLMGNPQSRYTGASLTTTIRDVKYGNGLYIAAYGSTPGYFIQTSTDALTWTTTDAQFGTTAIFALAYGQINSQDYYIAASSGGLLKYSTDLVSWNTSDPYTTSIQTLSYGEGVFMIGGTGGIVRSSTDGISWNTMPSITSFTNITLTAYTNGKYFVSGQQSATGVSKTRYSTDGVTWITTGPLSTTTTSTNNSFFSLVYKNGVYSIIGSGQTNNYYNSTDLVSWNTISTNSIIPTNIFLFNNGYGSVTSAGILHTSIDGLFWTTINATGSSFSKFANSDTTIVYVTTNRTSFFDISKGYYLPPTQTEYTAYIKK